MRIVHVHVGDRELILDEEAWKTEGRKGTGPGGGQWVKGGSPSSGGAKPAVEHKLAVGGPDSPGGEPATHAQTDVEPKKTVIAYKQFRTLPSRPGELFPLFAGNTIPVPIGKWVAAENHPTKGLAPRPGWHTGELPVGKQLRSHEDPPERQEGRVWAQVSVPADVDWQTEADNQGGELKDQIPVGGHYRFVERGQAGRGTPWYISGAVRVDKLLSDADVTQILRKAGRKEEIGPETRFPGAGAGGATFASPNLQDFPKMTSTHAMLTAQAGLATRRQKLFETAAAEVDEALGISSEERPAIGAWRDGAENTTMMVAPHATADQLRLSAAMKGWLGQQKQVLSFEADPAGKGFLYSALVKGKPDDIHRMLVSHGLENHTMVPRAADRVTVYVADTDGSAAKTVAQYARDAHVKFRGYRGNAEFIGAQNYEGTSDAEQRAEGRAAYEAVIAAAGDRGGAGKWGRLRDRWATQLQQTHDRARGVTIHVGDEVVWVESEHPRKGKGAGGGEFTTGSGGSGGGSGKATVSPLHVVHVHTEEPAAEPGSGGEMPKAKRDPSRPVYLRVGKWNPKKERSGNYAKGEWEVGVSVYDLDKDGEPVAPEGEWAEADLHDRMAGDDEKYLVQGDLVGQGSDGEPLLKNVRVVGLHGQPKAKPTVSPLKASEMSSAEAGAAFQKMEEEAAAKAKAKAKAEGTPEKKTPLEQYREEVEAMTKAKAEEEAATRKRAAEAYATYKAGEAERRARLAALGRERKAKEQAEAQAAEVKLSERISKENSDSDYTPDPARYQKVGGLEYTGPHAQENAFRAGRIVDAGDNRKAVEKTISEAGLKLVDPTDAPPPVAKSYGFEVYPDGEPKSNYWYNDVRVMAEGMKGSVADLEAKGFTSLVDHLKNHVNIVYAPFDLNGRRTTWGLNNPIAAVHGEPSDGSQWIAINTNNQLSTDWSPSYNRAYKGNTLSAQEAQASYNKAIKQPSDVPHDTMRYDELHEAQALALKGAMLHEIGHVLDLSTGWKMSQDLENVVMAAAGGTDGIDETKGRASNWMRDHFSEYAGTNRYEALAEVWFQALTHPKKIPVELKPFVKKMLGVAKVGQPPHERARAA